MTLDDDPAARSREVAAGVRRRYEHDIAQVVGLVGGGLFGIAAGVVVFLSRADPVVAVAAVFGGALVGVDIAHRVVDRRYRKALAGPLPLPALPETTAMERPEGTYVDHRVDLRASSSSSAPVAVPSLPPWKS